MGATGSDRLRRSMIGRCNRHYNMIVAAVGWKARSTVEYEQIAPNRRG
jgi:hypothetical protein